MSTISERQRLSHKTWQDELEAEENAAKEARERPIREATEQLNQSHRELFKLQQERALTSRDPDWRADPLIVNARMSHDEAERFNEQAADAFVESQPDYFPCETNLERITTFLDVNGIKIANKRTFELAFERLRELNLLEEWPDEPEPLPEPIPLPVEASHEGYPAQRLTNGWDLVTGEPRYFSDFELDQLSADAYRRTLRIRTVNRRGEPLR